MARIGEYIQFSTPTFLQENSKHGSYAFCSDFYCWFIQRIQINVLLDIIVHFIIQKLKNKHTFLKHVQTEKAEEPLILTEQEETKTRYFPPRILNISAVFTD